MCKKEFTPKSDKNVYHNRKCFKKAYYHKKRAEKLMEVKFPVFKCPSCSRTIELGFDPVKEDRLWLGFSCPFCSVLMINVWEEIITQDKSTT